MRQHLLVLQSSLPQLRASFSQACKGPLLLFILRKIHNLNSRFYSALLDTKNHKYTKLTGACHPTQAPSTPQIPNPTQDLPHNAPAAIGHVATIGAPTDSTDDVTSAATGYTASGTANAIDTAADTATSVSETNTTDIEDLPADAAPATANSTLPSTYAAPPTASTASSSRGDCSAQPCWVFTIPPDLPLTEDK
eukprot:g40268.t1